MNIPGTSKEVIEKLEEKYGYSLNKIVMETKLSLRTLTRALAEQHLSKKTEKILMMFYICIEQLNKKKAN